jgi:hypothetical protein
MNLPRLPEIMPGLLRLRLAWNYAITTDDTAAALNTAAPNLHQYPPGGPVTALRGRTRTGGLLMVSLHPADHPTHVVFRRLEEHGAPQPSVTHRTPLGGAARTVRRS